jgi:E3 ubiquitin-protein ligase SHPRH
MCTPRVSTSPGALVFLIIRRQSFTIFTDPIPSCLIDLVRSLSAKDCNQDCRPAKRRRTDAAGPESVTIIREQLVISRVNHHLPLRLPSSHVSGVQSQLRFGLAASDAKAKPAHAYIFTVSTRSSRKDGNFCIAFPIRKSDVSHRLMTIIAARDLLWADPGTEDAIWVNAGVQLGEDDGATALTFDFEVNWNVSTKVFATAFSPYQQTFRREILAEAFPEFFAAPRQIQGESCSPQMFYEAAHVPDPASTPPQDFTVDGLNATLYPFQRRAVQWMLRREGVQWCGHPNGNGSVVKDLDFEHFDAPSAFAEVRGADGQVCYVSKLLGKITKDLTPFQGLEQNFSGGILSEEMGLGKTVEILALCLLHRQLAEPVEAFDHYLGEKVMTTPATLIVCPLSLKKQWLSELNKHAPSLDIMAYNGLDQKTREDQSLEKALLKKLASHDIVVTTYHVLTTELDYALGEPDRARRNPRKYHRPRSPLTQLLWWRVCLDEAQMIESGISKAATLARLLPRVHAWGVTGTPVKDSVEDLRGLLLFLRYEPFASNMAAWNALIKSHQDGFRRLFNQLSLRHSKRHVRHEIAIPAQKRYVITMPFTAVEEQHYQNLFREVVEACGLDTQGAPIHESWDPEDPGVLEGMRTALDRLRQTALHPEVGQRNRRALGHRKGPMRTVAEVLDVMIEQSDMSIRADQRALLLAKLKRGQLLENSPRVRTALEIWKGVLETVDGIVQEAREKLEFEIEAAKSSGKERVTARDDANEEELNTGRVGEARRRYRSALEIQHKAIFFCANAYYQIKSNEEMTVPDSDEFHRLEELEVEGYDAAKKIRREILDESRRKADRLMKKISDAASKQSFAVIPEYKSVDKHGIESRPIVEDLELLAAGLNKQADLLDEWREHVIQLLLKALVDEDDEVEITGDEYEDSTKLMEEIVVYIQILRATIADREEVITGQANELVEHEARVSLQQAFMGEGPFPEKVLELFEARKQIKPKPGKEEADLRSLRAVVAKLRNATVKLRHEPAGGANRAELELEIVTEQLKSTQKQLSEQQKVVQAMNSELDLFTSTMNARVEFYRQLQNVSDSVCPYEGPSGDDQMNMLLAQERVLAEKLEASNSKHRYRKC